MNRTPWQCLVVGALVAAQALGCQSSGDEKRVDGPRGATLVAIEGQIYVTGDVSEFQLAELVRAQVRSAASALRRKRVFVSNRVARTNDPAVFERSSVRVVDPATGAQSQAMRVHYRLVDQVVSPPDFPRNEPIVLPFLHRDVRANAKQILRECTETPADQKGADAAVEVDFNPSLPTCVQAVEKERLAIAEARKTLKEPEKEIVPLERDRVYSDGTIVVTIAARTVAGYPRFERPSTPGQAGPVAGVLGDAQAGAAGQEPSEKTNGPREFNRNGFPESGGGAGKSPGATPEAPMSARVFDAVSGGGRRTSVLDDILNFDYASMIEPRFALIWVGLIALFPLLKKQKPKTAR